MYFASFVVETLILLDIRNVSGLLHMYLMTRLLPFHPVPFWLIAAHLRVVLEGCSTYLKVSFNKVVATINNTLQQVLAGHSVEREQDWCQIAVTTVSIFQQKGSVEKAWEWICPFPQFSPIFNFSLFNNSFFQQIHHTSPRAIPQWVLLQHQIPLQAS